jgi:hypothetical protein
MNYTTIDLKKMFKSEPNKITVASIARVYYCIFTSANQVAGHCCNGYVVYEKQFRLPATAGLFFSRLLFDLPRHLHITKVQ